MKLRFPIYAQILLWFFLNLLCLGLVFYAFFHVQFRFNLDALLLSQAGDRIQAVSEVVAAELNETPKARWNEVMERFGNGYQLQFYLFRNDGTQVAGEAISLPVEVRAKVLEPGGRAPSPRSIPPFRGPPPGRGPGHLTAPPDHIPHPKFMVRSDHPTRYWVGVRLPIFDGTLERPAPVTLLAMSNSMRGGGLFLDLGPWIVVGFAAVIFSVLFWIPLVRGITRSLSQVTRATEQIAAGHFETRVPEKRRDELGRLGLAINRMTLRLAGFVHGQKRFLGDIAHELCSPIARIQMALGILEQRSDPALKHYVDDLREEVQEISDLVNELLSFSKAGLKQKQLKLEPVLIAPIIKRVVARETNAASPIDIRIDETLKALAEPELLARALANLIRNAIRYAGQAGPITISATAQPDHVTVSVMDAGPGVPGEALQQIFDPFFRLETSRSRDTGGIGLGLAIVKTCVEACQGTVSARNRTPAGLQIDIVLKRGV